MRQGPGWELGSAAPNIVPTVPGGRDFLSWSEKQILLNPTGGSAPGSDFPSCSFSSEENVCVRGEARKGGGTEPVLPSELIASITHSSRHCPEGLDQPFLSHNWPWPQPCRGRGDICSPMCLDPLTPANHQLPLSSRQPSAGSFPGQGSPKLLHRPYLPLC